MKNLNHLAVIMDGNSRWASKRNLPSKAGHKEGVKKARLAVEYALEKKKPVVSLFRFVMTLFVSFRNEAGTFRRRRAGSQSRAPPRRR